MDAKSLITLELPVILERLADLAAFSASKELARSLEPSMDRDEVARRQQETSEGRFLLDVNPGTTIGGAHDVRPFAEAASKGTVLEPIQLLDIKSTMISARSLKRLLESSKTQVPLLSEMAEDLEPVPGLVDRISRILDERGSVLDDASEKLAMIRRDLYVVQDRLTSKLQKLVGDPDVAHMLQEPIITQRDGRFVIPLRTEFKGRIKSVIHDQSSSGATLFIEPLSVVDQNNQLRELELAERDEIRRILAELSTIVGQNVHEIQNTVEGLAALDLTFAKARFAEALDANEPILVVWPIHPSDNHPGSSLCLIAARHPLLDSDRVVPMDLVLDEETYSLVITGPNTGGKTVALKTTGLLVVMAQCGLHIPAESGSKISVFQGIYADIGDEQSIEQSLSTFSAHISNIIRILNSSGSRSLILLDELGAGTDPQEGAALARALLSEFLRKSSTTLVATHYPELKAYAHITPGVRNASVEFDLESLQPTYRLTIGLPGRSNALAIAERLGLAEEIIERARSMVAPEELRAEGLLDEIYRQRDATRQALSDTEAARSEAEKSRDELTSRLNEIEIERRNVLAEAREEAENELELLKEEIAQLRRQLAIAGQPLEVLEDLEDQFEGLEEESIDALSPAPITEGLERKDFQLGDRVRVATINAVGIITGIFQNDVEVQVGQLRIRAGLHELSALGESSKVTESKTRSQKPFIRKSKGKRKSYFKAPPLELDLRGLVVEEALDELEKRLDAASLAGLPIIRVIHGKGTGRLRQAIRGALKGNPYVASFEAGHPGEGGDGVTVVKLVLP
jgi:DNA mismatch repair protein MutS2